MAEALEKDPLQNCADDEDDKEQEDTDPPRQVRDYTCKWRYSTCTAVSWSGRLKGGGSS